MTSAVAEEKIDLEANAMEIRKARESSSIFPPNRYRAKACKLSVAWVDGEFARNQRWSGTAPKTRCTYKCT